MRKLSIIIPTLALAAAAAVLVVRTGTSQPAPGKLVVGIYAPSVDPTEVYLLSAQGTLSRVSAGLVRWKQNLLDVGQAQERVSFLAYLGN